MLLSEQMAFDKPVEQPDGYAGVEIGWSERYSCRAHIRYLRGGEPVQAARLQGRQPVVITIRRGGAALTIGPAWRARHVAGATGAGMTYNIRSIVPTDDRQYLEITADGGVAT